MAVLEIEIDQETMRAVGEQLKAFPGAIAVVLKRAIDRAVAHIKSREAKLIAAHFGITQRQARERLWIRKANTFNLEGRARTGKIGWPLILFDPEQGDRGVRVRAGREVFIAHAFIQTMPGSGHVGVFSRSANWAWRDKKSPGGWTRTGLPIFEERTESSAVALMSSNAPAELLKEAEEIVARRLFEEAELIWSGKRGYADRGAA